MCKAPWLGAVEGGDSDLIPLLFFRLTDIFKLQEERMTVIAMWVKMFSSSFPSIWSRRKNFKCFGFHQRMLFWEANKYSLLFFLWGKMKANIQWSCPVTSGYGSMISVIPPGLGFGFAIAFIFSLQPQRRVCVCWTAGYFWVGLCPWRVWFTVVCWKVLASKDKGLY